MKNIPHETEIENEESDFKPMTAQEAQEWRRRNPPMSIWKVVAGQALVGLLAAVAAWLLTGKPSVGWSAGFGALAVVVPAGLFARGVLRQKAKADPRAVMAGLFGWEIAKIALTVALLAAAPWLVPELSWLALLAGMVVTMKTYWVALVVRPGVRKTD
jgi:ATP synthase protein I